MRNRPVRLSLLACAALGLLIAAACGQKPGVAQVESGGLAAGGFDDGTGTGTDAGGDLGTGAGGLGTGTGTATGGGTGTGSGGAGTTGGGSTASGGGGGAAAGPGDRTGITAKEIVIGVHAPVTGAAPIPQESFREEIALYWEYLKTKGGVFGRNVRVVFEDDKFDPNNARRVCRKMVESDKAFLLIGGGGADQITECARYANSVGVPYLSAGVNEAGLLGIRAYFALSMSYSQQSPLIGQYARAKLGGASKKVAIAVADSKSFDDAYASIQKAFSGFNIVYKKRIPKSASQTQALSIAQEMSAKGAQIVYFLSSPTTFLNVAAAGAGQAFKPQYIGPGLTSGLQTVATVGCGANSSVDKAIFFSPFPQLDAIDRLDPEYQRTAQRVLGKKGTDLGIALWGLNKTIGQMFLAAGKNMSRQSLVSTLEGGRAFSTNVFPAVKYSAQDHLGASQVHVLQANCGSRVWKTVATFATKF